MTGSITGARFRRLGALVAVGVLATTLTACGSDDDSDDDNASGGSGAPSDDYQVKLGYFPNLTHASAIVGIEKGYFEDELAENGATLKTFEFNSGSDTIDALLGGDARRHLHRPQPDHHRVRTVAGRRPGHQRRDVRRRLAGRQRATSRRPTTSRARPSPHRASPTPRTSR